MIQAPKHRLLSGTALLLVSSLALTACDDFLEKQANPQGTLNEQTLANRNGVEGSLIATYRAIEWNGAVGGDWGNTASNWVWGSVTADDAYKGSEATDQPPIDDVQMFKWSTDRADGYLNQRWRGVYEGVVRSNATLRLLKQVMTSAPSTFSASEVSSIEGESKFLRAHFHFEAWRMWVSVPIYTEDDTDFREANSDSLAVLTQVIKDLDEAIAKLPATPRNNQVGRVTSWTAKAYKGRVLATANRWAEALTVLREVRTSGPYALESGFERVWTGFADAANGKETVFAYQASANDGEPNGNNANYGTRLNFPHSGSPFGCCGFFQPSQNLVNYFVTDANGLPIAFSDANWNARNTELDAAASANLNIDPRLDWTVGRDGVPYKDWKVAHATTWIRAPGYGGQYSPKKHVHELNSGAESKVGWVPTQLNSVNIHILRYADVLLLLAEAEVEAGSVDAARLLVNMIRTRAGAKAQGPGQDRATMAVAPSDPSITWAKYNVKEYTTPWTDKAFARDRVRAERRLELAMEGQRYFDLRRWGIAEATLNAYYSGMAGGAEKTRLGHLAAVDVYTAKHNRFPLPSLQISLSKVGDENRLTQNPGW